MDDKKCNNSGTALSIWTILFVGIKGNLVSAMVCKGQFILVKKYINTTHKKSSHFEIKKCRPGLSERNVKDISGSAAPP